MPKREKGLFLHVFLIGLVAAVFFIPFLGGVRLFDWDEINFAEISREMILTGEYLRIFVNFEPFWEKPPLFFWMQVLSMQVWGIGTFAARFPNAVCGILTLITLYLIGTRLYDRKFGLLWALVYFGSVLPHLYFRSGIIDPWFNFFIFLGLHGLILFSWHYRGWIGTTVQKMSWKPLIWGAIALGLAVLTKGQTAYLLIFLTAGIYWILKRFQFFVRPLHFVAYTLIVIAVFSIWYGVETFWHGPWFVVEFTKYQARLFSMPGAGHAGFPGYHVVVLLIGCFPASVLGLRAFFRNMDQPDHLKDYRLWMIILFCVVLVLFSIVQSKIVHYSSMCYFPLSYLAARSGYAWIKSQTTPGIWTRIGVAAIALCYLLATMALVHVGNHPELLTENFTLDENTLATLEIKQTWRLIHLLPGLILLAAVLLFFVLLTKKQSAKAQIALYFGTACFVVSGLFLWIGKIERYSQGSALAFYEALAGQDVYVTTYGFKSYGHYFYFRKPVTPEFEAGIKGKLGVQSFTRQRSSDNDWLLRGDIDKDVYIVSKVNRADELRAIPGITELDQEGMFVFFRRRAEN